MSNDDITIYGGVYGKELSSGLPENHLAFVDSHMSATAERVAHARHYWPERSSEDFDPIGTTGRKIQDRETGALFTVCGHDPLQAAKPEEDSICAFVVRAGLVFYLKPLGAGVEAGVGLGAAVVGGEVKQDWRGRPVVVDTAGNVVATRLGAGDRL